MAEPAPLLPIPACEARPDCRQAYYAASRQQCVATADQARGLQLYIRTAAGKSHS